MRELTKPERKFLAAQAIGAFLTGNATLAARGFVAAATGQWEGGERSRQRNRPGKRLESQDQGLDYGTRESMMSEARSLAQTFGVIRRIMRTYSNYCVGSGGIKWNTGDIEIDRAYRKYWRDWMPMADANGIHHFRKMTRIAAASVIRDGDFAGQKILDSGFGQVRMIEADRISTTGGTSNVDGERVIGGIGIDAKGQRTFARVWDRSRFGSFKNPRNIPFGEIFHVFDSDRADAYRGITAFHTALDAARDYKEIKTAERLSSKRISKLALLVKTVMGGAGPASGVDLFANDAPTPSGDTKINVQEVGDVADAYMFPNEDMKAVESDRPSAGWQWLMADIIREIAIGLDLPFGVVWNMAGLGGPAARFEINQAARTFTAFIEDVLEQHWIIPIAGWKIAEGISKGEIPSHPNWHCFKPQRPVYITIDLGRDSKAGIEENKAALLTAHSWFEETGQDFEEETETLFQEEAFRMQMAEKYKVPVSAVRLMTPNGNPATAAPTEEPKAA